MFTAFVSDFLVVFHFLCFSVVKSALCDVAASAFYGHGEDGRLCRCPSHSAKQLEHQSLGPVSLRPLQVLGSAVRAHPGAAWEVQGLTALHRPNCQKVVFTGSQVVPHGCRGWPLAQGPCTASGDRLERPCSRGQTRGSP